MQPEEAQAQPKAPNAVHDQSVAGPREEVQGETVLERRRESGVLVVVEPHGDAGKPPIHRVARIALFHPEREWTNEMLISAKQ